MKNEQTICCPQSLRKKKKISHRMIMTALCVGDPVAVQGNSLSMVCLDAK